MVGHEIGAKAAAGAGGHALVPQHGRKEHRVVPAVAHQAVIEVPGLFQGARVQLPDACQHARHQAQRGLLLALLAERHAIGLSPVGMQHQPLHHLHQIAEACGEPIQHPAKAMRVRDGPRVGIVCARIAAILGQPALDGPQMRGIVPPGIRRHHAVQPTAAGPTIEPRGKELFLGKRIQGLMQLHTHAGELGQHHGQGAILPLLVDGLVPGIHAGPGGRGERLATSGLSQAPQQPVIPGHHMGHDVLDGPHALHARLGEPVRAQPLHLLPQGRPGLVNAL